MDMGGGGEEKPALEQFGIDLTAKAKEGKLDPVIGRDAEIQRTIQVLSRRTKNNPVLLGEPGVGKTTVVEGLALRIVNADVPANLAACKLLSLDVGALGRDVAGDAEADRRPHPRYTASPGACPSSPKPSASPSPSASSSASASAPLRPRCAIASFAQRVPCQTACPRYRRGRGGRSRRTTRDSR